MSFEGLYSGAAGRLKPSIIRALLKLVQRGEVVSLAGGTPDSQLFDLDLYAEISRQAVLEHGRLALQYGETQGWLALREGVADYLAGRGLKLGADQVLITTGSQQAIDLLGRLFLDPGDAVAMEEPGYLGAIINFRTYGAQILPLPLRGPEGLDPAEVDAALSTWKGGRPKFLYLTPTYQNPSGANLGPERRKALAEVAAKHGLLLVEDDPYAEISFEGPPPQPICALAPEGQSVYLGSFSKMAVPGLRLGWIAGPPELIAKLTLSKESADVCSSVLAQAIAAAVLKGGHLAAALPKLRAAYRARRDTLQTALQACLPGGSKVWPNQGGFFLWAELPKEYDASALFNRAVEQGVAYVPGAVFYSAEGRGLNTMRLSYCAVAEDKLKLGAERLGKVLAGSMVKA